MTTTVPRPNREALDKAIGIYTDAMRPFIMRGLRRVRGANPEQAVFRALPPYLQSSFNADMQRSDTQLENVIEEKRFPPIVRSYWRDVFSSDFGNDNSIQNKLWEIKDARDLTAHRSNTDIDLDAAIAALYNIRSVLEIINTPTPTTGGQPNDQRIPQAHPRARARNRILLAQSQRA